MQRIAEETGSLAPIGGVDCDGDGTIDIPEGEPLVCSISSNGVGIGEAIIALVEAATAILTVDFDIKPESCPNPLNLKAKGLLPVAILGTPAFDVSDIDPASITLEGVPPIRSNIEDVAAPVATRDDVCDCTTDGADGFNDLSLKFDTQDIVAALGSVNDGDEVILTLMGQLLDGTPIDGMDCVIIKSKGRGASKLVAEGVPENYTLAQNYPNPFNPETEIRFQLPKTSHVMLRIFNTLGQEIRTLADKQYEAGFHSVSWDGKNNNGNVVSSGIYLYQLRADNFTQAKKMSLLR